MEDEKDLLRDINIKIEYEVFLCGDMLSYYFFLYMYLCDGVKL